MTKTHVRLLAYVASMIVGLLTVAASGQFNTADVLTTIVLTITASQTAYSELWKPSGGAAAVYTATTPSARE